MTGHPAATEGSGQPILVTGSHRSGSTWVGTTLSLGGRTILVNEPFKLKYRPGPCAARFDFWYTSLTADNCQPYEKDLERTFSLRYNLLPQVKICGSYGQLRNSLKTHFKWSVGRHLGWRALVKDPLAFFSAEWLAERFASRVVVTVRHPAAFAASLKRLDHRFPFSHFTSQPSLMDSHLEPFRDQIERFAADPQPVVAQASLLWSAIYSTARQYRQRHPDWVFVRHEDLSMEPVAGFRTLSEQLGLRFTTQTVDAIENMTGPHNPATIPEDASHHWIHLDSRANLRAWEKRLTQQEIDSVRQGTWDTFTHWYEPSEW